MKSKKNNGKITYDYKYDNLMIKIKNRNYKRSLEFQNFIIDIDDKDFVMGIRILDASKVFGIQKYVLQNIEHAEFKSEIEDDLLTIRIKFLSKQRNRIIPLFNAKQDYTQQITTPISPKDHLAQEAVACAVEA